MEINKIQRKTFKILESGRSTDFIPPSFIFECGFNCSYCYVKRHGAQSISVYDNYNHILTEINNHVTWLPEKEPNQCDPIYWTYDLGCNSDIGLHAKHINWRAIFKFFVDHDRAKGSFATKYVNKDLLLFPNPKRKIRIRFSLIPEKIRRKLEPNTSSIKKRLEAINDFYDAGYEVHVNFSPVVVYEGWIDDYKDLMINLDMTVRDDVKDQLKAEVIFLTHNEGKHKMNLENDLPGEDLIWTPKNQEVKTSSYGGQNIRYEWNLKKQYIKQFKNLAKDIIPYCDIRYIF